jgi:hypothetical protein
MRRRRMGIEFMLNFKVGRTLRGLRYQSTTVPTRWLCGAWDFYGEGSKDRQEIIALNLDRRKHRNGSIYAHSVQELATQLNLSDEAFGSEVSEGA